MSRRQQGGRSSRRMPGGNVSLPPRAIFGSNLELWLRADMGVTLNGSDVSAWADQSGKGDTNRNALQGTAANQPAFNTAHSGLNNRPAIDFDGVDEYLVTGVWSVAIAQPFTMLVVGKIGGAGAGNDHIIDGLSGTTLNLYYVQGSDVLNFSAGLADLSATVTNTQSWVSLVEGNGASSTQYVNRDDTPITGNSGTNGATGLHIGAHRALGAANFFLGSLAEVIIGSRILSDAERTALIAYAGARYGITIA